jgi:hypothetical protein
MKKEIIDIIQFDKPEDIVYWSKKWEISPIKIFNAFDKVKSNNVEDLKKYLREDGFAL